MANKVNHAEMSLIALEGVEGRYATLLGNNRERILIAKRRLTTRLNCKTLQEASFEGHGIRKRAHCPATCEKGNGFRFLKKLFAEICLLTPLVIKDYMALKPNGLTAELPEEPVKAFARRICEFSPWTLQ